MITRLLIFIKHKLPFIWTWIEWWNTLLFRLSHGRKLEQQAEVCFREFTLPPFEFRRIQVSDLPALQDLIQRQAPPRLDYFKPHGFELADLRRMNRNPAFLMFGVFDQELLIGYFFLRCFWNRKCFVGRLIDEPYEKRGIGRVMNQIMYHTAWGSGFHCCTTISRDNQLVMRSHANNPQAKVVKELANRFLLVEFFSETDPRQQELKSIREYLGTREK